MRQHSGPVEAESTPSYVDTMLLGSDMGSRQGQEQVHAEWMQRGVFLLGVWCEQLAAYDWQKSTCLWLAANQLSFMLLSYISFFLKYQIMFQHAMQEFKLWRQTCIYSLLLTSLIYFSTTVYDMITFYKVITVFKWAYDSPLTHNIG